MSEKTVQARQSAAERFAEELGIGLFDVKRAVCGFDYKPDLRLWQAQPLQPFRPLGLMIWDAPIGALLSQAKVSINEQVLVSWQPVPAHFFSMGRSYEEVARLLEEGIEPPSWCQFDTCTV